MNKELKQKEIKRIQQLCFNSPAKACAVAQLIIDTCQVLSSTTFAAAKGKSPRTIQYNLHKLTGIQIENRKFVSLNQ
jgi:hypothetical protein